MDSVLIDTHVFIWLVEADPTLPTAIGDNNWGNKLIADTQKLLAHPELQSYVKMLTKKGQRQLYNAQNKKQ
jgi:hypothetical protein